VLWLGLALSQEDYSWSLYSSLKNILAQYSLRYIMYFEEKASKKCENWNNYEGM
jgi:hypothetical protein